MNDATDTGRTAMLKLFQRLLLRQFGKTDTESGEGTIYIARNKVEMTDEHGTIVARGPARVAKVLRKRKAKAT